MAPCNTSSLVVGSNAWRISSILTGEIRNYAGQRDSPTLGRTTRTDLKVEIIQRLFRGKGWLIDEQGVRAGFTRVTGGAGEVSRVHAIPDVIGAIPGSHPGCAVHLVRPTGIVLAVNACRTAR